MNNEEEKDIILEMKVRNSDVERSGIVRMNDKTLERLGVDEDKRITISTDEKTIIRKAIADDGVKSKEIFIRPHEREELDVDEGDIVLVEDYDTISEEVKESLGDAKEKAGESIHKIRGRLGKSIEKIKERFQDEEDEQ